MTVESKHIANIRFLCDFAEIRLTEDGNYMLHRYGVPPRGISNEEAERLLRQRLLEKTK